TCGTASTSAFCDLSQYLTQYGPVKGQIYDPSSSAAPDGSGRTAYPSNHIPIGQLSLPARKALDLLPLPNVTGAVLDNFVGAGFGPFNDNGYDTRADFQATQNLHVFGRYSYFKFSLSGDPIFGKAIG